MADTNFIMNRLTVSPGYAAIDYGLYVRVRYTYTSIHDTRTSTKLVWRSVNNHTVCGFHPNRYYEFFQVIDNV